MKRILVTSTDSMMFIFLIPHINHLIKKGYKVDVACSLLPEFSNQSYISKIKDLLPSDCTVHCIRAARSPFSFRNYYGYKDLVKIFSNEKYDILWCNEPVVGFISRLAGRKFRLSGLKTLYMVHGFHFFSGGSIYNYILFPLEWFAAKFTDSLCVINKIDFEFAKRMFSIDIHRINGIGFESSKYSNTQIYRSNIRTRFGLKDSDFFLLSVGELNENKNHATVIKSLALLKGCNIKYFICGVGGQLKKLQDLTKYYGISNDVHFLGQRSDISQLLGATDLFIHPSYREGLGVAPLEAMASGLAIITSNRHGINDYSHSGVTGYSCSPDDVSCFANSIKYMIMNPNIRKKMGVNNKFVASKYDIKKSVVEIENLIISM